VRIGTHGVISVSAHGAAYSAGRHIFVLSLIFYSLSLGKDLPSGRFFSFLLRKMLKTAVS